MNPCFSCGLDIAPTKEHPLYYAIVCSNRKECERKGRRHLVCGRCFPQINGTGILISTNMMVDANAPLYMASACPTKEFVVAQRMMT